MDDQELELQDASMVDLPVTEVPVAAPIVPGQIIEPSIAPLVTNEGFTDIPTEAGGVAGLRGLITSPNPFAVETTSNFFDNLTGQQYPVDLRTNLPISPINEPLPYNEVPALVPGTPMQIKEKVGSDTTTSITPTAEGKLAEKNMRSAATEADRIGQELIANAVIEAQAQKEIDTARAVVAKDIAIRADEIREISKREVEASLEQMHAIREELKNTPWESYWGSKSTGDKIMLGLAVGLGSLAQAQIGGQNLAMQVIQSTIDDHNTSQKQKFEGLRERLKMEGALSVQTQQALKEQAAILDASKVANYEMLDKQLETLKSKVRTPTAVLKIEQIQQESRLKREAEIARIQEKYATQTTSARDVFQVRTASDQERLTRRADGSEMNNFEQKEIGYALDAGFYAKRLEELENGTGITTTPAWTQTRNAMINEARSFGALMGAVSVAEAAVNFGTMLDKYAQANPQMQDYIRNVRGLLDARLRKVTGATINQSELANELQTMLPNGPSMNDRPEHQLADIQSAQKARRHKLETSRTLSGSSAKFWYEVPNASK